MKQTFDIVLVAPCCGAKIPCTVTVNEDPGVHTFPNGDPGYPGSVEVEYKDGFPEEEKCPGCNVVWLDNTLAEFDNQVLFAIPDDSP